MTKLLDVSSLITVIREVLKLQKEVLKILPKVVKGKQNFSDCSIKFVITFIYYYKSNFTIPLQTAIVFTAFIISMIFFIIAPIFENSYEMFYTKL